MSGKKVKKVKNVPPTLGDTSGTSDCAMMDQAARRKRRAADDGGQDLKSKTPTEQVHVFEITDDFLPPEHEDFMFGWFWSLGDEHSPVAGPFASREEAICHAKLLVSPRPLIAEAGAKP
jgi:hypothetical protein